MTGCDDAVPGVRGAGLSDGVLCVGRDLAPGVVEARVNPASPDEVTGAGQELEVGDPIADVGASANGEDDLSAHRVCGNKAFNTSHEAAGVGSVTK